MPDVIVKVQGLEELKRRLEELSDPKTARAMMRTGSRAAAKVLLAAMQETVPVESGALLESLGIQVKGANSDSLHIFIGPDKKWNYIGRFHEFGTKFMAGDHWMQKSFDASSKDALQAYIDKVRQLLDRKTYQDLMAAIQAGLSEEIEE
jgi:HK97 gp10 family phage protein